MPPGEEPVVGRPRPPADERLAHAFADGYGEGIRDALKEILQAVRYSTPAELRWQVQSRMARIPEDVELKRRALLGPPPRGGWDALRRPPPGSIVEPRPAAATLTRVLQGTGAIFLERRPDAAVAMVEARWADYGHVVVFGRRPNAPLPVPSDAVEAVEIAGSRETSGDDQRLDLSSGTGRVLSIVAKGPALVYCESVDFLAFEYGEEYAVRALSRIADSVRSGSGRLVLSVDPNSLKEPVLAQLQRLFPPAR